MPIDIREEAAKFYDANPSAPDDIPFYLALIPSSNASVLELGCGTGRVTLPLSQRCGYVHGLDISPAMLSICQKKLAEANIPPSKACVELADITRFALERTFDLIIAPFRVFQNLETDAEVTGLFDCIHAHLAPRGTCILNVFMPNRDPVSLRQHWCSDTEQLDWEAPVEGGRIACYDRRPRLDPEKLVLYPELIYRRYEGEDLKEETVLKLVMRCYYPDQFEELIRRHAFDVVNKWGGYDGEPYGVGPELVIQFREGV
jgi:SAM-dependent methyltransferase